MFNLFKPHLSVSNQTTNVHPYFNGKFYIKQEVQLLDILGAFHRNSLRIVNVHSALTSHYFSLLSSKLIFRK